MQTKLHDSRRRASPQAFPRRTRERARCGSTLVAAIVAMAVASTMLFYVLKGSIDQQRQMRMHLQEVQANWLATAGIDRAIAQLKQSANYTGETWRVPANELNDTAAAEVTIRIEPAVESSERRIEVQADYPADTIHRSRKTKQAVIDIL